MDIVLTGTEAWAIDQVGRALVHAGHAVRSCYDVDAGPVCNASTSCGVCPATEPVDVIVAVRAHPLPNLTRREQATECPMLAAVPLVVAGSTVLNPYGSRADRLVEGLDGVEEACLAAALSGSAH